MPRTAVLLLVGSLVPANCVQLTRRACLAAAVAAPPLVAAAAEPTGPPVACDEECQQARVARKAELLRQQTRTQKADVKVLFGADFQAGRRESKVAGEFSKVPVLGEFLLPGDGEPAAQFCAILPRISLTACPSTTVGGINLQPPSSGAATTPSQ